MTEDDDSTKARHQRLKETLKRLLRQGLSQYEIAQRAGVPPQYLSDAKAGRRAVTELFARRLSERLGIDYQWLMRGRCVRVAPAEKNAPHTGTVSSLLVPVLDRPHLGEPQQDPVWDGSFVDLAGPAAVAARGARKPYALRLSADAKGMGFPNGALLLASQGVDAKRSIAVVKVGDTVLLARRPEKQGGPWLSIQTGKPVDGTVEIVGCVMGVIWASM